jgi:hypothetical protein
MWFFKKSRTRKVHIAGKEVDINVIYNPRKLRSYAKDFKRNLSYEPQTKALAEKVGPDFVINIFDAVIERVLKEDPSLILTDPFSVNLGIRKMGFHTAGFYEGGISSPPCAFININSVLFELSFFSATDRIRADPEFFHTFLSDSKFMRYVEGTIRHELRHHSEAERFRLERRAQKKFSSKLMPYICYALDVATEVRGEAVTTFESELLSGSTKVKTFDVKDLMKAFRVSDIQSINHCLNLNCQHQMALLMSYIIALNYLKTEHRSEWAQWANKAAKRINKLLSKEKNVRLEILPEKEIKMVVDHMEKMSMEEYFQEYEKACKRLGISGKNRFLTWRNYKKAMHHAYEIDMMFARRRGFLPNLVKGIIKKYFFG